MHIAILKYTVMQIKPALPVPTKSLLKTSPDAAMLFAPFGCTQQERIIRPSCLGLLGIGFEMRADAKLKTVTCLQLYIMTNLKQPSRWCKEQKRM